MTTLKNLKEGIGKAWDNLSQEWGQFMNKTSGALTRFTPLKMEKEDSGSMELVYHTPRLGFMASEVLENDEQIVARVEAPGMEAGDFKIEVLNDHLVVQGSKGMKREEKKGHYHMMECAYGSFRRAVPLPADVDVSKANASYKNGVLSVTLPKTATGQKKRIEVEVH